MRIWRVFWRKVNSIHPGSARELRGSRFAPLFLVHGERRATRDPQQLSLFYTDETWSCRRVRESEAGEAGGESSDLRRELFLPFLFFPVGSSIDLFSGFRGACPGLRSGAVSGSRACLCVAGEDGSDMVFVRRFCVAEPLPRAS